MLFLLMITPNVRTTLWLIGLTLLQPTLGANSNSHTTYHNNRVDLDYRHVTVSWCDEKDTYQKWFYNDTEKTIYSAKPNRCLSLAPNAVDLGFPCPPDNVAGFSIADNHQGKYFKSERCSAKM